jgi:hypothetical protein
MKRLPGEELNTGNKIEAMKYFEVYRIASLLHCFNASGAQR